MKSLTFSAWLAAAILLPGLLAASENSTLRDRDGKIIYTVRRENNNRVLFHSNRGTHIGSAVSCGNRVLYYDAKNNILGYRTSEPVQDDPANKRRTVYRNAGGEITGTSISENLGGNKTRTTYFNADGASVAIAETLDNEEKRELLPPVYTVFRDALLVNLTGNSSRAQDKRQDSKIVFRTADGALLGSIDLITPAPASLIRAKR